MQIGSIISKMGFVHAGIIGEVNALVNSLLHIIALMTLSFGKSRYLFFFERKVSLLKTVTLSFPNH